MRRLAARTPGAPSSRRQTRGGNAGTAARALPRPDVARLTTRWGAVRAAFSLHCFRVALVQSGTGVSHVGHSALTARKAGGGSSLHG